MTDNGVGMSHEDLNSALGTIANSGTRAFLEKMQAAENAPSAAELIGQFGIGFYSAFMVADQVVVETRRAGEDQAWRWTSDGKGDYEISALPLDEAPARGSRVILHLNAESKEEYLQAYKIERLISEHSSAVATPIDLVEKPGEEPRRVGEGAALWAKNKSEITPEQYKDFYQTLATPVRRARAHRALAGGRARGIYRAGLRAGVAAVRPVRAQAEGQDQALFAARADLQGRRPAARLSALHARGGGFAGPAVERFARTGAAEPDLYARSKRAWSTACCRKWPSSPRTSRKNSPTSGRISAPCSRKVFMKTPSAATPC